MSKNKISSEIEKILERHEENSRYINGLIKCESVREKPITKEEIEANRKACRDFLKDIGLR